MNLKNPQVAQNKHKLKRDRCLVWLGIIAVIGGILDPFGDRVAAFQFISFLIAIALFYCWIIYDGRMRGFTIPKYVKYIIALFGVIGIPIYFWQTRSFRQFCLQLGGLWLFIFHYIFYYVSATAVHLALS